MNPISIIKIIIVSYLKMWPNFKDCFSLTINFIIIVLIFNFLTLHVTFLIWFKTALNSIVYCHSFLHVLVSNFHLNKLIF